MTDRVERGDRSLDPTLADIFICDEIVPEFRFVLRRCEARMRGIGVSLGVVRSFRSFEICKQLWRVSIAENDETCDDIKTVLGTERNGLKSGFRVLVRTACVSGRRGRCIRWTLTS